MTEHCLPVVGRNTCLLVDHRRSIRFDKLLYRKVIFPSGCVDLGIWLKMLSTVLDSN
jgi:hypothetical protein